MKKINIFWFRRDLRLNNNHGLYEALKGGLPLLPIFIFDKNILDELENKHDARVHFIHEQLKWIHEHFRNEGSGLEVFYGFPDKVWNKILNQYSVHSVFTNRDYEPYAIRRDNRIKAMLHKEGIAFHTFKDHVIFEKDEVLKANGDPYTVFTPYKRRWLQKLESGEMGNEENSYLRTFASENYIDQYYRQPFDDIISLREIGFEVSDIAFPPKFVPRSLIEEYGEMRDFPGVEGTSRLGVHFRFGTISIREKARRAQKISAIYLNELIWRDFYSQILAHFPHVVDRAFRPKYDRIEWRNHDLEFQAWCEGKTGYPIVDAGMRELNTTGYMHNRVRMITASFLTKHLLIDWRWGEAYFAKKLLDYDLASNNGGWQWAAGSGTDAAPYFRIFNPHTQLEKFDKKRIYVRKWIPEYDTDNYPGPIVDHKEARERCLEVYKMALAN